jgi:hypothetical protein
MSYFRRQFIFPGQQEGEEIHLVIRQHPIVLVGQMLLAVLFLAIYFGISFVLKKYLPVGTSAAYIHAINVLKDLYLMFVALGVLLGWVIYYLNVQIVTNKRAVDITQKGLLSHTVAELDLNHVEDVTAEVEGFFPTMFDFGNVYIQTAAERERFVFSNVPHPTSVEKLVLDLYDRLPSEGKTRIIQKSPENNKTA